jgi:ERCC4-related helicase
VTAETGTANLPKASASQKLVIFTEHRDTLSYLEQRISTLLGREEAVVCIHGGMGREERMKTQEFFRHDPEVKVLLATDAAGEGINLQRAPDGELRSTLESQPYRAAVAPGHAGTRLPLGSIVL